LKAAVTRDSAPIAAARYRLAGALENFTPSSFLLNISAVRLWLVIRVTDRPRTTMAKRIWRPRSREQQRRFRLDGMVETVH
jgi:hypothetical protein